MTNRFNLLRNLHSFDFPGGIYRAQPLRVVDGDTVDLFMDRGKRIYDVDRYRLLGIDTPELNDRDPAEREKANEAKEFVIAMLGLGADRKTEVDLTFWPVLVELHKPDSFGRWLAEIAVQTLDDDGELVVTSVAAELLERGLAKEYQR